MPTYIAHSCKAVLLLIIVQLIFVTRLRAQTPTPTPSEDKIVVAVTPGYPTLVPYKSGMTFLAAMTAGGDLNSLADIKNVYLVRCGEKTAVNLIVIRKDPSKEPTLKPWDIIYLPKAPF